MRKSAVLLLTLLLAGLAGCVDDDASDVDDTPVVTDDTPDETEPSFGPMSGLPRERPADFTPSFDEAPQWVLGEWWDFELTSYLEDSSYTNTRVVAGKEGINYLVGMPIETFSDGIMVMHTPGFGLVDSTNLGFEAHDVKMDLMQFPVEEGNTWSAYFESTQQQLNFLVEAIEGNEAQISISGTYTGQMIYDAQMGAVSLLEFQGYSKYEVVAHGFDYEGQVRVPHSHDLIFFHGRLAQAQGVDPDTAVLTPNPKAPTDTITIPDLYDRVSFGLIVQDLGAASTGVGSGLFQIDATAPNGETYSFQKLPTNGNAFALELFANDEPAGDWTVQYVAAGAGLSFIEGIGYVTFDVNLPSGCVEKTSKIHDHGGDCGGHAHNLG